MSALVAKEFASPATVSERRATLAEFEERYRDLRTAAARGWWDVATKGDDESTQKSAEARKAAEAVLADAELFARVKAARQGGASPEPELDRALEVIELTMSSRQGPDELIADIATRTTHLQKAFGTFRPSIDGTPHSDNEFARILQESDDAELRRKAWEASKEVGASVRDDVLTLVHKRNELARACGYANHYAASLARQELTQETLSSTLQRIERATREPFRTRKAVLDAALAERFDTTVGELEPWHYADPFFQRAPKSRELPLDDFLGKLDFVDAATRFYDGLGMDVRDVVMRSDLEPRDGKNQHAFCTDIDREGDIRILCNLRPDARWLGTLLHELGHAVYDRYIDRDLPWTLRTPCHTMVTEAIAMLMGRQAHELDFLVEYGGAPAFEITPLSGELRRHQAFSMLVFTRWVLVMNAFEKDLYENPDRDDLDELWWEYVSKYQLIDKPEGRSAPDWAAKLHIALAPVYYHNYLFGEIIASQLRAYVASASEQSSIVDNQYAGEYLIASVFQPGNSRRWDQLLEDATEEPLNPSHFLREFVGRV